MTVKAPSERNFRRASAKGAKRRRFRPRLSLGVVRRLFSVLLLLFGVYQSIAFAFTTPLLRVNRISVHGNVRLSSGQVQALVEDLRGSSILRLNLDAVRQRLVESPWVADVALRRVLPSTVEVFVSENGSSWTIVLTRPDGWSCIVAVGQHWESLPGAVTDPLA